MGNNTFNVIKLIKFRFGNHLLSIHTKIFGYSQFNSDSFTISKVDRIDRYPLPTFRFRLFVYTIYCVFCGKTFYFRMNDSRNIYIYINPR